MGYWIWICEFLVIVFSTEACHRLVSLVKGSREGETMRERLRMNAHRSERRVIKSESASCS